MKKFLPIITFLIAAVPFAEAQRYVNEMFSDADLTIENNVTFATNIDFLISDFSNQSQVGADITELKTAVATQQPIPAKFYNPSDQTTDVKVTDLKMDLYYPSTSADNETSRPVIVYLHTGNFLPPPINGSPLGLKNDSMCIEMCKKWARRGYVAVSIDYRLGWNPLASTVQERRGTLLNAVYRAIHDTKMAVRFLKTNANGSNDYGINPAQIVLFGEGTGAYVANAYSTMDKYSEISLPKFTNPANQKSYIDTSTVGNLNGYNGLLNLYVDGGVDATIQAVVTAGGALADTSWLEAGDAPMIAVQCIRDPFAPYDEGTVIVPTTMEDVVDVQGANVYIKKADDLGNNDELHSSSFIDPYSTQARTHYGKSYGYFLPGKQTITVQAGIENHYPVLLPLGQSQMTNQAAPWQWWDPESALAKAEVAPGVTAHQAALSSNPDMSPAKGKAYCDTITNYMCPRLADLFGYYTGVEEINISSDISIYPNPTSDNVSVMVGNGLINKVEILDVHGKVIMSSTDLNNAAVEVSVAGISEGIYFVRVHTADGIGVTRLIKE